MSIRWDASGDSLTQTANLPTVTSFTIMAWFYAVTLRSAFSSIFTLELTTGVHYYFTGLDNTNHLVNTNAINTVAGGALSAATWYHVCSTVSGTGAGQFLTYLNGVLDITGDGNPSMLSQQLILGNDLGTNFINGRLQNVLVYTGVLTALEIQQQMLQHTPVRTAGLRMWRPFLTASDLADYSGQGSGLTIAGTVGTEDPPPLPWGSELYHLYLPAAAVGQTGRMAPFLG